MTRITGRKAVRARKNIRRSDITTHAVLVAVDIVMRRVMPSDRQLVEWVIRAMKAPFDILRLALSPSSRKRYKLLCSCTRLLNSRTRVVRLSQIKTLYANDGDDTQPWVRCLVKSQENVTLDISNGGREES